MAPLEQRVLLAATPSGVEFPVNTTATGPQGSPAIASDADGDLVVVWQSTSQDGSGTGIFAQRYDAAGSPVGSEFSVNSTTTGGQANADVAMDASGDMVVVWDSASQDGSGYGVYGQRFTAAGLPDGTEFLVNTFTTGSQRFPTVAMDSDGDFVIVWQSASQDGSFYGVYAQRFSSAGALVGSEFRVNTTTADFQNRPAVAMDSDGDFVVAWNSFLQDGASYGVYAQRFTSLGGLVGSEFQVNATTTGAQRRPRVGMDADGDFVVVWMSGTGDGSGDGIFARRYSSGGAPVTSEFRVNSFTTSEQVDPSVAMDSSGDFVVTWSSFAQDGSGYGVFAQSYLASGAADGSEVRVNTFTTNEQIESAVAMDAGGDFVVVWQSAMQDGDSAGVFGQRFAADSVAPFVADITDDEPNNLVVVGQTITYTVTFSEPIDAGSLGTADFVNFVTTVAPVSAASFTVGTVSPTATPSTFLVSVTIDSAGVFVLSIAAGATVVDLSGNAVPTSTSINDNDAMTVDTVGPWVVSITDSDINDLYFVGQVVTFTVTFNEDIDASSLTASDFGNAEAVSPATFTIGAIAETSPTSGVFTIAVTLTSGSVFRLRVNDLSGVVDAQTNAGPAVTVADDSPFTLDVSPPSLLAASVGDPDFRVRVGDVVLYTLSFNETMETGSFSAADFENLSPQSFTIGTVAQSTPGVVTLPVTAVAVGALNLQVKASSTLADEQGNLLPTSLPIYLGIVVIVDP